MTLAPLHASLEALDGYTTIEEIVEHELDFHRQTARASRTSFLAGLVDALWAQTGRVRVWRGIADIGVVERTVAEHRGVYWALADGDASLAAAHRLGHIAGVERWLRHAKGEISS
ncbi:UNVERIFIED_CONTAM: FCD domain-containing protein [Microbacterium sp. SLM126]